MINAYIDAAVLADFPAARLFAVVAEPCNTIPPHECTPDLVPASVGMLGADNLAEHPVIFGWRQIFAAQGLKPSQYRSSLEALMRRLTKGQAVNVGVPAVDLYNALSVSALAPMGAYDVDKLADAPIVLRYAEPLTDTFMPIGGKAEDFPLTDGIIVYAQNSDVLCWAVNHRDSDSSRVEPSSERVVFFAEGLTASQVENAEVAIVQLRAKLQSLGVTVSGVLTTYGADAMAVQVAA